MLAILSLLVSCISAFKNNAGNCIADLTLMAGMYNRTRNYNQGAYTVERPEYYWPGKYMRVNLTGPPFAGMVLYGTLGNVFETYSIWDFVDSGVQRQCSGKDAVTHTGSWGLSKTKAGASWFAPVSVLTIVAPPQISASPQIVNVTVEFPTDGVISWVVIPTSAPSPSQLQILKGQDSFNNTLPVGLSGNYSAIGGVTQLSFANLSSSTSYTVHFAIETLPTVYFPFVVLAGSRGWGNNTDFYQGNTTFFPVAPDPAAHIYNFTIETLGGCVAPAYVTGSNSFCECAPGYNGTAVWNVTRWSGCFTESGPGGAAAAIQPLALLVLLCATFASRWF